MSLGTPQEFRRGPYVVTVTGRKMTVTWRVESTDGSEDETELYLLNGIPNVGDAYTDSARNGVSDSLMRCKTVSASREGDKGSKTFLVSAEFNTDWDAITIDPPPDNPLDRPATMSVSSGGVSQTWTEDLDFVSFASSAGEPYEPGLEVEEREFIITIRKNLPDFDITQMTTYLDTVNNAIVNLNGNRTIPAELARIDAIEAEERFEFDVHYFAATVVLIARRPRSQVAAARSTTGLAFTPSPWDVVVPDHGMYQIVSGKKSLLKDDQGLPLSAPAYLDGSGAVLPVGQSSKLTKYRVKDRTDFNDLTLV